MANYSRYGSYFLADEKSKDSSGKINVTAKPINRKRYDFVNDTDPDNFADNINDTDLEDDGDDIDNAPEGFPVGDISDEPDDPSDNVDPFPDDNTDDDIPDFPEDDNSDTTMDDFPTDDSNDKKTSDTNNDIAPDGDSLLNDIIKNKMGNKLPTPDEIIDDLKKQVYDGSNQSDTPDNQSDINNDTPDFPTDNNQQPNNDNNQPNDDTSEVQPFPGDENNQQPTTDNNGGDAGAGENPPFPEDNNATNVTANPDDNGAGDFPGGDTDFTNGADQGGDNNQAGANPPQQQGAGVGYDSMRKYNLYKEYQRLLDAVGNYISKLENLMFDEPHQNLIVKIVIDKLNEVKKLCYDYLTMKFEIVTYTQAYVFFEELAVSIQVIFTMLMTVSDYNKLNDDTKKKKSKKASNKKNK